VQSSKAGFLGATGRHFSFCLRWEQKGRWDTLEFLNQGRRSYSDWPRRQKRQLILKKSIIYTEEKFSYRVTLGPEPAKGKRGLERNGRAPLARKKKQVALFNPRSQKSSNLQLRNEGDLDNPLRQRKKRAAENPLHPSIHARIGRRGGFRKSAFRERN